MHKPIPEIYELADRITDAQLVRYITKHCNWVTLDQARASKHVQINAALRAYAGPNIMAHHDGSITLPGMGGVAQLFDGLFCAEAKKVSAGGWLRAARWNRARGAHREALMCLEKAANDRRAAQTLPSRLFDRGNAA